MQSKAQNTKLFLTLPLKPQPPLNLHFSTHEVSSSSGQKSSSFGKQAFSSLLQSHSSLPNQLKQVHALLLTTGISIKNSLITQLLTNFVALGEMTYARNLFDEMHKPRQFLWNTMIKGYVKNELPNDALSVYGKMHRLDVRPDSYTFPFVIKACAQLNDLWVGLAVHVQVLKHCLEFVPVGRTELMVMYVKFGDLVSADYLFRTMLDKDLVAWNALIGAYAQTGHSDRALQMLDEMRQRRISPDVVTVVSSISACANLGCLETGEEIYDFSKKRGIENNMILQNALLDLYMKCGSIESARNFFHNMPLKNVVSWSTMIVGYAMNGDSGMALEFFSRMKNQGVKLNCVTLLGVLSACSHSGLVREGRNFFNFMANSTNENIKPRKEHYACMVDLLGRSGKLKEAYDFVLNMPFEPDPGIWGALLGACVVHHNTEIGQKVADLLFKLAPDIGSYHVLLSNMYAASGRWKCVEKVRLKMRKRGAKKVAGYSSVEFNGQIHVLYGGDKSHPQAAIIYTKLEELSIHMKSLTKRLPLE